MPRLSRTQEAARQQIARLASSGLPVRELGEHLLAAIEVAVQSDMAQLCAVDPTTLLFNRLLAVGPGGQHQVQWYLQNLYLKEPAVDFTHPGLMRACLTAVVLHDRRETSWGLPGHLASEASPRELYEGYHAFTGVNGGVLRAFFPADGRWIAALDLARLEPDQPFRPTDVAFLRLVAPLIGQGLRMALDRERAMGRVDTADTTACGVLMLAPNGHIQSSTPAAESWLNTLQAADLTLEHHLPAAIWSAIAGLRAGRQQNTQASVNVQTRQGRLRIEASPAGDDGTVAIVLVPNTRSAPPAIPTSWEITRQERQVVEQVLRGMSNRQIARALVVSEHTVESHLKHVYEKLTVQSRSQLLARYFAEVYDPDLF